MKLFIQRKKIILGTYFKLITDNNKLNLGLNRSK